MSDAPAEAITDLLAGALPGITALSSLAALQPRLQAPPIPGAHYADDEDVYFE